MTRCLLADGHPAVLLAVGELLRRNGFEVAGPVPDGPRAVTALARERPELALVEYRMPRLSGADLVAKLVEASPETAIVVYTADVHDGLADDALGAGARAVVLKEAPLPDLIRALEAALAGRIYLDPLLAYPALLGARATGPALRPRELEVLRLLAEGFSHGAIGARLEISGETVRSHLRGASGRLGAGTRTQAVATALRLGLID